MRKIIGLLPLSTIILLFTGLSGVSAVLHGGQEIETKGIKQGQQKMSSRSVQNFSILVIYDNNPHTEGLTTAWGFSCLIKGMDKTILFDTGGESSVLLANMKKTGIDPEEIDCVILSHTHADHTGGLRGFLEVHPDVTVYLPKSFSEDFKNDVKRYGANVVEVSGPLKICENVHSTGELGKHLKEQSLIMQTDKGFIVITGCAHPGILHVIHQSRLSMTGDVLFVMGGFHLTGETHSKIKKIVAGFRKFGVAYVGPCHCSGDIARALFKKAYQKNYIEIGVGKLINMKDLGG